MGLWGCTGAAAWVTVGLQDCCVGLQCGAAMVLHWCCSVGHWGAVGLLCGAALVLQRGSM